MGARKQLFAAGVLAAACVVAGPASAGDDPLDKLLAEGSLAKTRNPVPASFLLNEGGKHLTADQRASAVEQLRAALKVQTNAFRTLMEGATGAMNSDAVKQQMDYAKRNSGASSVVKSFLGIQPPPPPVSGQRMQQEVKEAMVDPWVRGIEAAHALAAAGDAQGAATFYVNCLQMLEADWVPSACVDGIVDLGTKRAGLVLNWMIDNADTVSITGGGGFGQPPAPAKHGKQLPDRGALQLRVAALEGLGALAAPGQLEGEAREAAMAKILSYSAGKDNEPFYRGAALGLGRSRDPRVVDPLRRLAKDPRQDVKLAALRGLAVAFRDDAAIKALRSELGDRDLAEQLKAAQVLFEVGDDAAFRWAVDTIGHRRTSESKQPDIRPQVVRSLVNLGGEHARPTLEQALAAGTGNDWLEAWVRVALLELGDANQLAAVQSALAKEDWSLDPRGFASIWHAIKPLIMAAAQTVLSGGMAAPSAFDQVRQAVQLISNFASGERGHYLANADARKSAIAQLHWQTADALAVAPLPGAAAILARLLDDPVPAVRLSAARALAALDSPDALDGIAAAFGKSYGDEGGISRTAEVRGALLRAALIRFPHSPGAGNLLANGASDADPGVRFISLAGQRPAS
jgi:HEAT repeat protein